MALNTDALPNNLDESKCYAPKGKTLSILIKKAKQKLIFSKRDFTVSEDDNKLSVMLRADHGGIPYVMGETSGGSHSGGGSGHPPAVDMTVERDDTWSIDFPPLNISDQPTNGVTLDMPRYHEDGGTTYIFQRTLTYDSSGRLIAVSVEHGFAVLKAS